METDVAFKRGKGRGAAHTPEVAVEADAAAGGHVHYALPDDEAASDIDLELMYAFDEEAAEGIDLTDAPLQEHIVRNTFIELPMPAVMPMRKTQSAPCLSSQPPLMQGFIAAIIEAADQAGCRDVQHEHRLPHVHVDHHDDKVFHVQDMQQEDMVMPFFSTDGDDVVGVLAARSLLF